MPEEKTLDKVYEKWEEKEKSKTKNIIQNIPIPLILLVVGIMLIGYLGTAEITGYEINWFVGLLVLAAIVVASQKRGGKVELTPAQAYAILQQEIQRKMDADEVEKGEIKMGDQYTLVRRTGPDGMLKPDHFAISFVIMTNEGLDKLYQGNVLAYTGTVSGIWETPGGFDKNQEKDVLRVIPRELLDMRKKHEGY